MYVRRNYACESKACGWRWTTAEIVVNEGVVLKRTALGAAELAASMTKYRKMMDAIERDSLHPARSLALRTADEPR